MIRRRGEPEEKGLRRQEIKSRMFRHNNNNHSISEAGTQTKKET
jgi:hypothetical protein